MSYWLRPLTGSPLAQDSDRDSVFDAPHQATVGEHPVPLGCVGAFLVVAQPPPSLRPGLHLAVLVCAVQVDPDAQRVLEILRLVDALGLRHEQSGHLGAVRGCP
jgi:hypothetical protein